MSGVPIPRFDPSTVEAVVFDIGGVLTYPDWYQAAAHLDRLGVALPPDRDVYRRAHHAGIAALTDARLTSSIADADIWPTYDRAYGHLIGVPEPALDDFRLALHGTWRWRHEANAAALGRLATAGFPIAIVSNNDGTAAEQMRDLGICWVQAGLGLPVVRAIIDSSLVGVAKPDPAIMAPALYALGVPADRVLYVGDTAHVDIPAAHGAGMQAVQLDPYDDHPGFSHPRLPDVAAVAAALGV